MVEQNEELYDDLEEEMNNLGNSVNQQIDEDYLDSIYRVTNFYHMTNYEIDDIVDGLLPNKDVIVNERYDDSMVEVLVKLSFRQYLGLKLGNNRRKQLFDAVAGIIFNEKDVSIEVKIKVKWLKYFGWEINIR